MKLDLFLSPCAKVNSKLVWKVAQGLKCSLHKREDRDHIPRTHLKARGGYGSPPDIPALAGEDKVPPRD